MIKLSDTFDAYTHARARNHSSTAPWLRTQHLTTKAEQQAWWDNRPGNMVFKTLLNTDTDEIIGMVGFTDITKHDAEFSCLIYPKHRKQGHGLASLHLLFDYGFTFMGLKRIYGWTYGYANKPKDDIGAVKQTIEGVHFTSEMYLNPAFNLFKKIGMEIYGPCLYPNHTVKGAQDRFSWRLELMRYNYDPNRT